MIIKQFDLYDFRREFERYDKADNFSDEALEKLFDYYDDLSNFYELDVINICCSWTEYENLEEFAKQYINDEELEGLDEYDREKLILAELDNNTFYIKLYNGAILVQNY